MTDRELLELAAKAAGYARTYGITNHSDEFIGLGFKHMTRIRNGRGPWNPLTNDGDALRLAVQLGLHKTLILEVGCGGADCEFNHVQLHAFEAHELCPYAATRRAIVRAAAEIGRKMK